MKEGCIRNLISFYFPYSPLEFYPHQRNNYCTPCAIAMKANIEKSFEQQRNYATPLESHSVKAELSLARSVLYNWPGLDEVNWG